MRKNTNDARPAGSIDRAQSQRDRRALSESLGMQLLFWLPLSIWVLCSPIAFPQGACKTVNANTSSARCTQEGAACTVAAGTPGHCQFNTADRVCDCQANTGPSTSTAVVSNEIPNPVYVNLYWDASWDTRNPKLKRGNIDGFTAAMLQTGYFGGLSEYGVKGASFGGSFLPAPGCDQSPPSEVEFYAPFGTSIAGFLNCELEQGALPTGPQVVYNIILPQGSVESDFFGARKLCSGGGSANAWHFHQNPYSALGIAAQLLGAATGGVTGALEALLIAMVAVPGGPVYTITSADSSCGVLTENMMHEMIEAATDPFPSLEVIRSGGDDEIADLADQANCPKLTPFVPPSFVPALAANSGFPSFDQFTTGGNLQARWYWSNAKHECTPGLDITAPSIQQVTMTGNGATLTMNISGTGFGTLPFGAPTVPYIAVQDRTQGWQAGNSLNSDEVGLNLASWTDSAVTFNGFNFKRGNLVMKPGDLMNVWVCNPSSGQCGGSFTSLIEPGAPELNIAILNLPQVYLTYNVSVDGTMAARSIGNGGRTSWLTEATGAHSISESATTPGHFAPTFPNNAALLNSCDPTGKVTLNVGDNQICTIVNTPNTGCSAGQHCCGNVDSKLGCVAGCVSTAVACVPLCPKSTDTCCTKAGANGKCDSTCVASRQFCQ